MTDCVVPNNGALLLMPTTTLCVSCGNSSVNPSGGTFQYNVSVNGNAVSRGAVASKDNATLPIPTSGHPAVPAPDNFGAITLGPFAHQNTVVVSSRAVGKDMQCVLFVLYCISLDCVLLYCLLCCATVCCTVFGVGGVLVLCSCCSCSRVSPHVWHAEFPHPT